MCGVDHISERTIAFLTRISPCFHQIAEKKTVQKNRSLLNLHRLRFGGAMVTDKGATPPPPPPPLSEPMQAQKLALESDNLKWFTGVGIVLGLYLVAGYAKIRIRIE